LKGTESEPKQLMADIRPTFFNPVPRLAIKKIEKY